ncbi:Endoribonuclease YbeY, partial [Dissostichus eleginoides]
TLHKDAATSGKSSPLPSVPPTPTAALCINSLCKQSILKFTPRSSAASTRSWVLRYTIRLLNLERFSIQ